MSTVSIPSEQAILGAMLLHEDMLVEGMDLVSVEMFHEKRHQVIFNAMIDVYRDSNAVDQILVGERLREIGKLEEIGGFSYLTGIMNNAPVSRSMIKPFASKVKEAHLLRCLSGWGRHVQELVGDGGDPKEILSKAESALIDVAMQTKEEKKPDISSIMQNVRKGWEEARIGGVKRILTPRNFFNREGRPNPIPFYHPGHLWMIAAPSTHGKTTFMIHLMREVLDGGASVMIFSLEDSQEEKAQLFVANIADVPRNRLISGVFTPDEERVIQEAERRLLAYPLMIFDNVRTVEEIRLKVKKEKLTSVVDIVVIDFIQRVRGESDIYKRMVNAIEKLADMADELAVTIVCLSQMTDETKMKGAGELFEAADIVLVGKRPKREASDGHEFDFDLVIDKNRGFGPTGRCPELQFSKNWTKIQLRGVYR